MIYLSRSDKSAVCSFTQLRKFMISVMWPMIQMWKKNYILTE